MRGDSRGKASDHAHGLDAIENVGRDHVLSCDRHYVGKNEHECDQVRCRFDFRFARATSVFGKVTVAARDANSVGNPRNLFL